RSTVFDFSLGITYYLGRHQKHVDWKNPPETNDLDEIEKRVAALENKKPPKSDFLFFNFFSKDSVNTTKASASQIANLTVQFPFDKAFPQKYSLTEISYVRDYMMEHKDSRILITGY